MQRITPDQLYYLLDLFEAHPIRARFVIALMGRPEKYSKIGASHAIGWFLP